MDRLFDEGEEGLASNWRMDETFGVTSLDQMLRDGRLILGTGSTTPLRVPSAVPISGADLRIASAMPTPAEAGVGETVSVQWTTKNAGMGAAFATWVDAVFISANDTLDSSATQSSGAPRRMGRWQPGAVTRSARYDIPLCVGDVLPAGRRRPLGQRRRQTRTTTCCRAVPVRSGEQPDLEIIDAQRREGRLGPGDQRLLAGEEPRARDGAHTVAGLGLPVRG